MNASDRGVVSLVAHAAPALCWLVIAVSAVPMASAQTPAFDGGRAFDHLRAMVGHGPRPAGSAALEQTRQYIRGQMSALGITVQDQAFDADTPIGKIHMVNLRATIPGTRPERVIIAGHYDTKLYRQFRFVGANDGGSSGAFLVEIARVLKRRKNPWTIELLFLDGEEAVIEWTGTDHTYGSRYYVEQARKSGDLARIKAMILVDMIGDRNLNIRREAYSTPWLTDLIWSTARAAGFSNIFLAEQEPIEDDHKPFLEAGVPAVDLIDLHYPPWHTADDTLDKVSARSLEVVGQVLLAALPKIEARLLAPGR